MFKRISTPVLALMIGFIASASFWWTLNQQDTSLASFLSGAILPLTNSGQGQVIRINLYNHQLALYENGVAHKISRIAAAGNPNDYSRTPIGTFRVLSKERSHTSRLSGAIMPWSMRFHQGYYIHDIPSWPNGNEITTRYSLGCVRLAHDLAPEVYSWAQVGAQVQTHWTELAREAASPTVYKLTADGYRHRIATERAFTSRGYRWEDVAIVHPAELAALPLADTLY